jgi:ABC-type Fe3+-siderophore transport system permease subunit
MASDRVPVAAPAARRIAVISAVALTGTALLAFGSVWDLMVGDYAMTPGTVVHALFAGGHSIPAEILRTIRLPRVTMAAVVGFAMAVSGVIMQGATANPLGAPDIVGVTAGAALVVVAGATVFSHLSGTWLVLLSFAVAAVAAVAAFGSMGAAGLGQGRANPVRLALAGVTVTAILLSFTQALLLLHQNGTAGVFFWLVGGVNYASWHDLAVIAPWLAAGTVGALLLAAPLNILGLGEDTARGLGLNVNRVRFLGVLCVIALAGAAVAVAGPIGFIGIIVPHITRRLVGSNHAVVIPLAGLLGAALLVLADLACRFIQYPYETPTGIVTALIGAPFFLYLARRPKAVA